MGLFSTYCDVADYIANNSSNVETASLIGGNSTLANSVGVVAQTLVLESVVGFPSSGGPAWILDGYSSESVQVASVNTVTNTLNLAAPYTLAAHAAGVSVSSAGVSGCLASVIQRASALIETICRQGPDGGERTLFQLARTDRISGPNMFRAFFDVDRSLVLRPYHFPVVSATSVVVQMGAQSAATIDLTYLVLPDAARLIYIPWAQVLGAPPYASLYLSNPFPRAIGFVATLAYIGGPIAGTSLAAVPSDIKEAAFLLINERLAYRQNSGGAAMIRMGDTMREMRLRGDKSGMSLLRAQAQEFLTPYIQR